MARVEFERVTKQFDDYTAVRDLSLTIADEEFLVLVGPSGCGKTTSLRMLAGLEKITKGNIYIGDRRVNEIPPKDRDIAMVFQSYALYPHMSVYENMAFGLSLRGMKKSELDQRVRKAADQMGIEALLDRKPKELSGGQRQRVAVCRAIVRNPSVFLMDEPLSNLDAKLRVQARTEISRLQKELGTTFIYVTHDQVEAMTMGDRIAVLNNGILQQADTPQNLYTSPSNMFVAGFIGSPAMNFFDIKLAMQEQKWVIQQETFTLPVPADRQSAYAEYADHKLVLGIRPEAIYDLKFVPPGIETQPVRATITLIEPMGNEVILYLTTPDRQEFVARVDRRSTLQAGETVDVGFDVNSLHLFEAESQQRISVSQPQRSQVEQLSS